MSRDTHSAVQLGDFVPAHRGAAAARLRRMRIVFLLSILVACAFGPRRSAPAGDQLGQAGADIGDHAGGEVVPAQVEMSQVLEAARVHVEHR